MKMHSVKVNGAVVSCVLRKDGSIRRVIKWNQKGNAPKKYSVRCHAKSREYCFACYRWPAMLTGTGFENQPRVQKRRGNVLSGRHLQSLFPSRHR